MDRSFRRKSTPALPAIRMQLPSNVPDAVILSGRYIDLHDPLFAEHGAPEKGQDHETGNSELLLRSEVLPFKLGAHRFLAKNSTITLMDCRNSAIRS
jgi:hypothetical protein